jgi:hypothetical protein
MATTHVDIIFIMIVIMLEPLCGRMVVYQAVGNQTMMKMALFVNQTCADVVGMKRGRGYEAKCDIDGTMLMDD